ncbi:hypothetical protein ACM66B_000024 [Microbotryomycetes sp. NB124-2]
MGQPRPPPPSSAVMSKYWKDASTTETAPLSSSNGSAPPPPYQETTPSLSAAATGNETLDCFSPTRRTQYYNGPTPYHSLPAPITNQSHIVHDILERDSVATLTTRADRRAAERFWSALVWAGLLYFGLSLIVKMMIVDGMHEWEDLKEWVRDEWTELVDWIKRLDALVMGGRLA